MLKIGYRNINITFDNHEDLFISKSDIDKITSRLDILLDSVKYRYERGVFEKDSISFVRLKNKNHLSIFVGIGRKKNPYLFVYNSLSNTVTNDLPYESFKMLDKDIIMGDLEDKLKNIGNERYHNLISKEVYKELEKLADEYDERC